MRHGLRVSYALMVAAARAGVPGVHTWACAQQEFDINADVTAAVWQVFRDCKEYASYVDKPLFNSLQPFEDLQPAQLEDLLFLAVSMHGAAAQGLLQLIRDPGYGNRQACIAQPWPQRLSAAQQQRLQAAVLQLPTDTVQQLLRFAMQRGFLGVSVWFKSWPALLQPS